MPADRPTEAESPVDPVSDAVAACIREMLGGAEVDLTHCPEETARRVTPVANGASATGPGPAGWTTTLTVRIDPDLTYLATPMGGPLGLLVDAIPEAALRAAARFRTEHPNGSARLAPAMGRALRDTVVAETLSSLAGDRPIKADLVAEILEYLIGLGGSRVESHDLTHGVVVSDVLADEPRLRFEYPADLREAKRGPLLFDGQRSVLVIDPDGMARTELQRHRLDRLAAGTTQLDATATEFVGGGSLVAEATRRLGGIGFFLRDDRTIWTFVDGRPLLIRRAERWTAFPLELTTAISNVIGGGDAASIVVNTALMVASQRRGAILAIVEDPASLEGIVSPKDRFDLRDDFDPMAMRTETRLHHLIDAGALDATTLARLAGLDGATILDGDARLLAYGAVVTSSDSEHEGARTAAAKTLSHVARVVLKVSVDGDITVFHNGRAIATLLR